MARRKLDPDKVLENRNKKFYKYLSKTCQSYDEYKDNLTQNNIGFIEISFGNCEICIPEDKFNTMSQLDKDKIFKYFR